MFLTFCFGICYPVCGMMHIKEPLLLIRKSSLIVVAAGFLSCYLNGSLPCVPHHITLNKINISFLATLDNLNEYKQHFIIHDL